MHVVLTKTYWLHALWMFFVVLCTEASESPGIEFVSSCQLNPFPNGFYKYTSTGVDNATSHQSIPTGRFVIAKCNPGFRLIGDQRLQCETDGNLHQHVICEDIDECEFEGEDADYSLMTSSSQDAGYPCMESATCLNTPGSFSCQCRQKPIVPCHEFIQCDELPPPEFGSITEQSLLHVVFACNDGYQLNGSDVRMCVDGSWNGIQPMCQVTTCQPPSSIIAHGWSDIENRPYVYGEEIHYGCDEGYRLVGGNSWRVCVNTYWTSQTPSCQAIQCQNPGRLINGEALVYSRDIGGEVHFRCKSGNFQLLGSPVRVCRANGRWDGTMTTCNNPETYCPTPAIPFNGRMSGSTSYAHGDVIYFECNHGYDLIGSTQRRCTATGQWDGEQPVCRAVGEYDDIIDVGRHLVETTSLFRDEFQIQRRFMEQTQINITTHQHVADPEKPGRLATIPRAESESGENRGLDVYFVFDVSKSVQIGKTHLEAIKFAKAFVEKVGVSSSGIGGTRYGAIAYASTPLVVFQLDGNSTELVHHSLDSIKDLVTDKHLGQGTATSSALHLVHSNMIPHTLSSPQLRRKRDNADRVLFLLTDGQTNMEGSPAEEATVLKEEFHVAIHCIGIGNEVNRQELKKVASEPEGEHSFILEDFRTLDELTSTITTTKTDYTVCGISRGPQNTDEDVAEADDVWPWQAALYTHIGRIGTPSYFCGGTLVAPNWILSAAHCFDPEENPDYPGRDEAQNIVIYMGMNGRITAGGFSVPKRAQMREVKRIVIHSNYDSSTKPTYDYDIALLELQAPFDLDPYVRTVCLPPPTNCTCLETLVTPGEQNKPYATGWGKRHYNDEHFSNRLKQLAVPIRQNDDRFCRVTESETHGHLTERMFCAGYADGTADTCSGDSGGPLVRRWLPPVENIPENAVDDQGGSVIPQWRERWYQIGIISWGENCAKLKHYGYYTYLPSFTNWVKDVIN